MICGKVAVQRIPGNGKFSGRFQTWPARESGGEMIPGNGKYPLITGRLVTTNINNHIKAGTDPSETFPICVINCFV